MIVDVQIIGAEDAAGPLGSRRVPTPPTFDASTDLLYFHLSKTGQSVVGSPNHELLKPFLTIHATPHVRVLPPTKVEGVVKKQQEKEKQMWSKAFS